MKFPKLLCFAAVWLSLQPTFVVAQGHEKFPVFTTSKAKEYNASQQSRTATNSIDSPKITQSPTALKSSNNGDQLFFGFNQAYIHDDYDLFIFNAGENQFAKANRTVNYASSAQHIVTDSTCGTPTVQPSFELHSDHPTGRVCDNDSEITVTVSSSLVVHQYQFFVNGISIQGPSIQTSLTHELSSNSTITVIALPPAGSGLCSQTQSLFYEYFQIDAGSIQGGEMLFRGEVPAQINSVNSAQVNGVALTTVSSPFHYQWESSSDGVTWNAVLGAVQAAYTPPVLIQTTHFRIRIENFYDTGCLKHPIK